MDLFLSILKSVIYGVIEGITEWLPISSTGHMILAEQVLKFGYTEDFMEMFRVVIQLGAILAVVVLYFHKLWPFCKDNGRDTGFAAHLRWPVVRLWFKIIAACVPAAVLGILLDDWMDAHLYNSVVVALMLIVYGVAFILIDLNDPAFHDRSSLLCWPYCSTIAPTSRLNFQRKKHFMKDFYSMLRSCPLFSGISEAELNAMLPCLNAEKKSFPKDAFVLRAGDTAESIGLVLSGSVLVIQEDIWGNRNILSKAGPGQTFAAAFACAPGSVLNVSVIAEAPVTALFLNVKRILTICPSACAHHSRIIRNLLSDLAGKNLLLNEKLTHIAQRTTRAKLMSYLSAEAQRRGAVEFDIPFSRQQLADFLAVERSGLSLELGKMKKEGLLDYHKEHFVLNI